MKKRLGLFAMATMLIASTVFSTGVFTALPQNTVSVAAARKMPAKKDITRESKKERTIIKGKTFELEVNTPEGVNDKDLNWSIKDKSIVTFAGKERHDDDIKFRSKKAGKTKITCKNVKTGKKVSFNVIVKEKVKVSSTNTDIGIKAIGSLNRTLKVNHELELEVKKSKGIKDSQLKWTIDDESVLAYEDPEDGIYDDDMEFVGKKAGTTNVKCTNTKNNKAVTFKITVK
ncbi:MAG: hypothetical protein Q4E53_03580 [Eubacteriales bacterium]|nr:hypothetical protein [Eubacteriales bacterium]